MKKNHHRPSCKIFGELFALFLTAMLAASTLAADQIEDFQNPPDSTKPGCYWYWINDNISKQGITKDLEAMERVGIGRAYIGNIFNGGKTPVGDVKFYSNAWWQAMQWAVKEGARCHVDIGFFNGPGWSQSGGPWIKPNQSMRYLGYSETNISGGRKIAEVLPVPAITTFPMAGGSKPKPYGPAFTEKEFQDVRVVAIKLPDTEADDSVMKGVTIEGMKGADLLLDGSTKTSLKINRRNETPLVIHLSGEQKAVQSLSLKPLTASMTLICTIEASQDGKNFKKITEYVEERGHQGSGITDPILIPFTPTDAREFRITLSPSAPLTIAELSLSRRAVLGHYVRKELGETDPSVNPPYDAYIWPTQNEPAVGSSINPNEVIDLTAKMDASGKLTWDAPPGNWKILRMGMIPTGISSHPASPEATGLEVDKLNEQHIRAHFEEGMMGQFLKRTPAADRTALKYAIADSYETGPQNWTDGLLEKFEKKYGYSAVPWLPVLTGCVVGSADASDRFLWDFRRLLVESVACDYVGGLRKIANENGLKLWLENYGHWGFPSEFLLYGGQADEIAGEFWESQPQPKNNNIETRAASSAAHIYGKREVYAESFTSNRTFQQIPAELKRWLDWVYSQGINQLILHVYIHQPGERKPGIIQWFGTGFNRHNTWFEQAKPFFDYMRRCAVLLQTGLPVADVAYYLGEDAPNMQGERNPELPDGYDFDYINSDVLIHRTTIKDGKIVVKDGPSYAVLVLPDRDRMRPEVLEAIGKLAEQGATIVGKPPTRSPSLQNYPACDAQVQQLAKAIWSNKKNVLTGGSLEKILTVRGTPPDVQVSGSRLRCAVAGTGIGFGNKGGIVFKHRQDGAEQIYFLSNTSDKIQEFTVSLRQSGMKPELWDAVTGKARDAAAFRQEGGRTLIPLRLEPTESVFVVFREACATTSSGKAHTNQPEFATQVDLKTGWSAAFPDGQGAPTRIRLDELADLSQHSDPTIQNYSGTIVYRNRFNLPAVKKDSAYRLELGQVGVIATVWLNGWEVGGVWTAPWAIDITDHVRAGANDLEIRVANTWNNRLSADADLPEVQRKSYVSQPYKPAPLQPSGLMGPVLLQF